MVPKGYRSFNLGKFKESVADFERFAQLDPRKAIYGSLESHFYTGQHQEGRAFFESIKRSIPAMLKMRMHSLRSSYRWSGCRKILFIDIQGDRRVPMMEVWAFSR